MKIHERFVGGVTAVFLMIGVYSDVFGAAPESSNNIQFTRPAGWQRIDNFDGSVLLVPPNTDRHQASVLIATGGENRGTDIESWFNHFWALVLEINRARVVDGGQGLHRRAAGVDTMTATATLETSEGQRIYVDLMTAAPGARLESVVFMARRVELYRQHRSAVQKLWRGIRFANALSDAVAPTVRHAPPAAPSVQASAPPALAAGARIHRIYRGVRGGRGPMALSDYNVAHYLLFTNSLIYRKTIMTGPAGVDPNALDRDELGSYRILKDGVAIVWSWGGEDFLHHRLFEPVPPVDGMRLQGLYRRDMGGGDVAWIEFTADGRFREQGVVNSDMFGTSLIPGRHGRPPYGTGTYELRDYTLFLNHEDGRIYRATFYALSEGKAQHPQTIVLNTYELTR